MLLTFHQKVLYIWSSIGKLFCSVTHDRITICLSAIKRNFYVSGLYFIDKDEQSKSCLRADDPNYHQGASFGLNFVTYAEYTSLKSDHEKLQVCF